MFRGFNNQVFYGFFSFVNLYYISGGFSPQNGGILKKEKEPVRHFFFINLICFFFGGRGGGAKFVCLISQFSPPLHLTFTHPHHEIIYVPVYVLSFFGRTIIATRKVPYSKMVCNNFSIKQVLGSIYVITSTIT